MGFGLRKPAGPSGSRKVSMATITRFEDLDCWQKARELTKEVYSVSGKGAFGKDWGLKDQIRRAAVSVMANIAEGFERGGNAEFIQFLAIAKGSAAEVEAQLYAALDQQYLSPEDFGRLKDLAVTTGRMIGGFIRYLRKTKIRGPKFK